MNTIVETEEAVDVQQTATPPAIGVIALKFVVLLSVIVALFALAWSR